MIKIMIIFHQKQRGHIDKEEEGTGDRLMRLRDTIYVLMTIAKRHMGAKVV